MRQETKEMIKYFFIDYGWAILVVLVAIGTLAYFGVLDPEGYVKRFSVNKTENIEIDLNKTENIEIDLNQYTEECYEYNNIMLYNITITYYVINSYNNTIVKNFIIKNYNNNSEFKIPFYYENLDSFPVQIDFKNINNNTICTKWILVKEELHT